MKKNESKQAGHPKTASDAKRNTPFHHLIIGGLARFWFLALIPPLTVVFRTGNLIFGLIAAFAVNSLLTALFYREDKFLAENNYWRIPEKYLHLWAFFCGWPGALYAQHAFRHKRSKTGSMIIFWLCAMVNVTLLVLLFCYADPGMIGKTLEETYRNCGFK